MLDLELEKYKHVVMPSTMVETDKLVHRIARLTWPWLEPEHCNLSHVFGHQPENLVVHTIYYRKGTADVTVPLHWVAPNVMMGLWMPSTATTLGDRPRIFANLVEPLDPKPKPFPSFNRVAWGIVLYQNPELFFQSLVSYANSIWLSLEQLYEEGEGDCFACAMRDTLGDHGPGIAYLPYEDGEELLDKVMTQLKLDNEHTC